MSRSKHYWDMKQHKYPHQVEVPHMSADDINPRLLPELIGWQSHFLRVPFDGVAHWGFEKQEHLNLFKQIIAARKVRHEARA